MFEQDFELFLQKHGSCWYLMVVPDLLWMERQLVRASLFFCDILKLTDDPPVSLNTSISCFGIQFGRLPLWLALVFSIVSLVSSPPQCASYYCLTRSYRCSCFDEHPRTLSLWPWRYLVRPDVILYLSLWWCLPSKFPFLFFICYNLITIFQSAIIFFLTMYPYFSPTARPDGYDTTLYEFTTVRVRP